MPVGPAGKYSVPVLWDTKEKTIVNNEVGLMAGCWLAWPCLYVWSIVGLGCLRSGFGQRHSRQLRGTPGR